MRTCKRCGSRTGITPRNGIRKKRRAINFKPAILSHTDYSSKKTITDDEKKEYRLSLLRAGYKIVANVESQLICLRTINQGRDGACSIAALCHLIYLSKREHYLPTTWDNLVTDTQHLKSVYGHVTDSSRPCHWCRIWAAG